MALVYLAQSDTTIGLLSKDSEKLNALKNRPKNQSVL
ncbi:Sua5 YciO YrdC YwlC family protein, partial [Helicobacter pylori]|nr:Sua5 YciO YrdC YwlC family protein [Helicobacter pylori]